MANTRYRLSLFSSSLCMEFMRVSPSLSDQSEVVKITVWSGEDFSYHDDCGNYAQGLTPNPLPAVNLSPSFCIRSFFTGANLVCTGNLVMNAIKNLEGLRWVRERQLVFSCMELLVPQSSLVWWERWPSEGRIPRSCGDWLLYVFWYAVDSNIVCLRGVACHTGSIVCVHGHSCIMYSAEGYVLRPIPSRIQYYSVVRSR